MTDTQNSSSLGDLSKLVESDKYLTFRLEFLKLYRERIEEILQEEKLASYYSLALDLSVLIERFKLLYDLWEENAVQECARWNRAASAAQHVILETRRAHLLETAGVKENVTVRFMNKPKTEATFPTYQDLNRVVQVEGLVNSLSQPTYVEHAAEYTCNRCDTTIVVKAEYHKFYDVKQPMFCKTLKCNGQMCPSVKSNFKRYAHSYQEVFLEELNSNAKKPRYATVTLEDDLVDSCQLGDVVIGVGTVENRQKPVPVGKRAVNKFTIKMNSIRRKDSLIEALNDEQKLCVADQWNSLIEERGEFGARDFLIESFCPDLFCLYIPKLAVLLALASCVEGEVTRPHSHVLLIGEPGLAKSKLLERAVMLSARSFFTGGYRVSKVGLTAGVLKVDGEDVYEAGVLPLCDGGICCIDEFNLMSEDDKACLHEAMEQQTISIAKTGVIAKLKSRCAIIAAANPRNVKTLRGNDDDSQINCGIQPALLSRFDIVLVLRDDISNPEWDRKVTRHVLTTGNGQLNLDAYWTMDQLKMHLLAAREEKPQVTDAAKKILIAYYQKLLCVTPALDASRTTARALDGLFRIAKAYCRLLLKKRVMALDAVVIIRLLMENCYGMGALVASQFDPVQKIIPLGPTEEELTEVLRSINLFDMVPTAKEQLREALRPDGRTIPDDEVFPNYNPQERTESRWNEVLAKNLKTQATTSNLLRQNSNQIITPNPPEVSPMISDALNRPQRSQVDQIPRIPSEINFLPQHSPGPVESSEPAVDLDEDLLLADILGDSEPNRGTATDLVMQSADEPHFLPSSLLPVPHKIPERPETTTTNDVQPAPSPLSGTLKKLHEQFAFSQVQRRRKGGNEVKVTKSLPVKVPEGKNGKTTMKKRNTLPVPLDGIDSTRFGNILQGVAAAFAPQVKPPEAASITMSKSSINELVDDSFFDD